MSHLLNSQINEECRQPSESVRLIKGGRGERQHRHLYHTSGAWEIPLLHLRLRTFLKLHFRFGGNADDLCLRSLLCSINESYHSFIRCVVAKVTAVDSFSLPAETIVTRVNVLQRQHFFVATPQKMAPETKLSMEDSIQKIKTTESFDMGQCRHLNYFCIYKFFFITTA